jgi:hypothetical protein
MTNDPSRPSTLQIGDHTYPINPTTTLTSASSPTCTCEFLSWGKWTSSVVDPRDNSKTLTAFGTYVAGTQTTAMQMPQTGSATYNGIMSGNVNGSPSTTSGSYQMGWNFANRAGNFNGNFDGRTYNGAMSAVPGSAGVNFAGPLSGGDRSGSANGSFFGDGAKNQGGAFSIGNARSRYQATGIFAGQR